jgi:hypothetical protein
VEEYSGSGRRLLALAFCFSIVFLASAILSTCAFFIILIQSYFDDSRKLTKVPNVQVEHGFLGSRNACIQCARAVITEMWIDGVKEAVEQAASLVQLGDAIGGEEQHHERAKG